MQSDGEVHVERNSLSPRMRRLITGYNAAAAPSFEDRGLSEEMRALVARYVDAVRERGL